MSEFSLYDLFKDCRAELHEQVIEYNRIENGDDIGDVISEIADTNTPIYTYNILQYAVNNLNLATDEPEIGPAFDGTPTPINIIAANIYEAIAADLWEYWNDELEEMSQEEPEEETEEETEEEPEEDEGESINPFPTDDMGHIIYTWENDNEKE